MNAGSGVGEIFTSMTIYTGHSLQAYPVTTPPPKRVSDRMCPAVIHEQHLHGEHSKSLIAKAIRNTPLQKWFACFFLDDGRHGWHVLGLVGIGEVLALVCLISQSVGLITF